MPPAALSRRQDMVDDEAPALSPILRELREVIHEGSVALDLESELRRLADAHSDAATAEDLRRLAVAFGYYPSREGNPYWGPMIVLSNGSQYPADLDTIEPELPELWAKIVALDPPALVQARLADLLWCRREGGRPYVFGHRAIDAYLVLAQDASRTVDRLDRVDDGARAMSIARELNDNGRVGGAAELLTDLARQELAEPHPAPGIVFRALEPLVPDCPDGLEDERQRFLLNAVEAYERDPFHYQSASELYASTLPADQRTAVYAAVVDSWEAAADTSDGLTRLLHLERAIELAKLHDLSDRLDGLRVKTQRIDPADLGMQTVRSEVEIVAMDEILGLLVHETWADTIAAIGSYGPPTGTRETNLEAVQQQRGAAPFQAVISRTKLGFANSIIWRAESGTEDRDRLELAEIESFRATYTSFYVMAALDTAYKKLGAPTTQALTEIFSTNHIEPSVATKFARGVTLYLSEEYELAALYLLPYIEACIRHLNNQAGLVVILEPRGTKPGGVKTLGTLISQMTDVLDRDWCRYLESTLTDPLGHNLRNRALHGLMDAVSKSDAALLVHIVCFLSTLRAG